MSELLVQKALRVIRDGRLFSSLQRKAMSLRDSYLLRSVPRAEDPYSSHLPVLIGLGKLLGIQRVLEFGAGVHSTPVFLNGSLFPAIKDVLTYENDAEWGSRVRGMIGESPALRMYEIAGDMAGAARDIEVDRFDLVFVDDSIDVTARSRTIRAVAALEPKHAIVVIHDFEIDEYRRASMGFSRRFRFRSVNPNVGVLWNGNQLRRRDLRRISDIIRANSDVIPASSVHAWADVLGSVARNSN